jgi:hypothetical protein
VTALALLLFAAAAPAAPGVPRPKGDALVELAWKLGARSLAGRLASEDLLYGCAEVAACAGACADSLTVIGDGRGRSATLCPELQGEKDSAGIRKRAEAFVRRRLTEAAGKARSGLGPAERDRLDCGLERLGAGKGSSKACAGADARSLPRGLEAVAENRDPEPRGRALAALCAETGCGRGCVDELNLVVNAPWSELGRAPANDACPLSAVFRKGPPEQAGARATAWVTERLLAMARDACKVVEVPARGTLSCASVAAGLAPAPGVCGPPPAPCP